MKFNKLDVSRILETLRSAVPYSKMSQLYPDGMIVKGNTITAMNETMRVSAKVEGLDNDIDVPFVLSPRSIDLIINMPPDDIEIKRAENGELTIRSGKIRSKQAGVSLPEGAAQYDEIANIRSSSTISAKDLYDAINDVSYAVSKSEQRAAYQGICFEASNGVLDIVALDGYRSAWKQIKYDEHFRFILPSETAKTLLSLNCSGDIAIDAGLNYARITAGNYEVVTRLIAGSFAKYADCYPPAGEKHATVPKTALLSAIKRLLLTTEKKENPYVCLLFEDGACCVSATSTTSDYSEYINLDYEGLEGFEIAFNPAYLVDCFKAFKNENVDAYFTNELSPVLCKDGDYRAIILPVRKRKNM